MKNTLLAAALALTLTGSLAIAQQTMPSDATQQPDATMHHQHRHNPHREAAMLSKRLNLTPDQTAKLEPILADRDQKMQALHANTALSPDERKQQMRSLHTDTMQQLNSVLTPDQIAQMKSMHHRRGVANATPTPAPGL